jgi:nucleoside-diphosphate-sugar epimerase
MAELGWQPRIELAEGLQKTAAGLRLQLGLA